MTDRTPITGSSVRADQLAEDNPALAMVLARIEAMEQQNRLMVQEFATLLTTEMEKDRRGFVYALRRERQRSQEALQAVQEKLQQQLEKKPIDPHADKAMLQQAIKQAEEQAKHKRRVFIENLKKGKYPTGEIVHLGAQPMPITLNGVTITLDPGKNTTIPAPYIEAYQAHLEDNELSQKRAAQIAGHHSFGDLETWRAQGSSWEKTIHHVDEDGRLF